MANQKLLVIGAGPGGYSAAFLAADKGMEVTLVDSNANMGGVCLQQGCIPSKTLLHLAKLINETREAKNWGLSFGEPQIDLEGIRKWKSEVVEKMTKGLSTLCKQRDIKLVTGKAVFKSSNTVEVSGNETIGFDQAVIAVGSHPAKLPGLDLDDKRLMDSTSALEIEDIPKRLLVVGGGYIGLEMGTIYSALGSRVTVVEMTDGLLPGVDRDLVRILQVRLKKEFDAVCLNTKVNSITSEADELHVWFDGEDDPAEQIFDRVLVSVGRRPNSEGLGLENTKVEVDETGYIKVDNQLRTADPSIFAIGDVVGGVMLAHKASHEGKVAIEVIAGENSDFEGRTIPAVVFTDPEVAWCGLTETEAKAQGHEVDIVKFPWGASGRATTLGRNDGQTKLILQPGTERVLGVGMVGAGAGELIGEGVLAVETGCCAKDLASTIHPHPTLSETIMEAAELPSGFATHIIRRK